MEDASLAMSVARCRIAIGVAAVVAPGLAARVMGGRRRSEGVAPLFARMLGGRDIALGLGTIIALDRGRPVRGWLEGSALADAVDCVACVLAREDMSPAAFSAAAGLGATSALVGALLARRLDPPPSARPGQPEAMATGHSPQPIADR
jgi:peptide-methionine (R)-S-oxide reductase